MTRTLARPAFPAALLLAAASAAAPSLLGAQTAPSAHGTAAAAPAADTYVDPTAARLHGAAVANWQYVDETVVRYTALVKHRLAAALRTPLKDRTLYRSESASRVFWDRDRGSLVQLLASREQTPAGVEPPDFDGAMDDMFDPAGDRLLFGMTESDDLGEEGDDDFWFHHPLAPDAEGHYRFATGDTLTLALPDGRAVEMIELRALPRVADVHRISGSLWIEPESGALVRAVYRLADRFDAFRDVPDLREEEEEDLKLIPGLFKPWTFELSLVAVDYGLWNFEVWLPRSVRVEGVAAAGILKAPVSFDLSYAVEAVVTEDDLAAEESGENPVGILEERRFETREEAMRFMASLLAEEEGGVAFEPRGGWTMRNGRRVRHLVPVEPERLHDSPHLPPPVWEDAPGFPTEEDIEWGKALLADLPQAAPSRTFWAANWGLERPDLVRYNRVEGPAIGGRFQLRTGSPFGPVSLELVPFLGFADLEPKATLSAQWENLRRKTSLSAYRRMRSAPRRGEHLELGNSLGALLFGRDDGEYFLATGADVVLTPPTAERQSWTARIYAERHDAVRGKIDFALSSAFDDGWRYRENITAREIEEVGAEIVVSPWWGTDPLLPQVGAELYVQGAAARDDADDDLRYGRASALLRAAVPFGAQEGSGWKIALEAEAGQAWGDVPLQRSWFLGSASTLRGYVASALVGEAFARSRVELARVLPVATVGVFSDAGWAGTDLDDFAGSDALVSVGLGVGLLDGLVRLDLSRGLREPEDTRLDFYLDAAF